LQVIRAGNVSVANTPGCGLVESPVFMAFLPELCRRFLGEELRSASVTTWWCGDDDARRAALSRFDELVFKPAFQASGGQELLPRELSAEARAELRARIAARPEQFVAQETVARSAAPIWNAGTLGVGHLAYRCFLASDGESYSLMPGALIRVAPDTRPMQLSIAAGAGSKDLWVQSEGPVDKVTLRTPDQPVRIVRSGAMFPSRVADDLFWLGWALDRADFLTRLTRAAIERLASETGDDYPELRHLFRALADQGQIAPDFVVDDLREPLPPVEEHLPRSLFDDQEPNGLARAMTEVQRLSARTRDWLSPETWRQLHESAASFLGARVPRWDDLADVLAILDRLQVDLASVSGLMHFGMIRGPAWRFLDLGRRIERGRNIGRLVASMLLGDQPPERSVLKAVIEVLDVRMTYRSRYLDNIQPNGVFDLAITDETNPNSIGFQAAAVSEHVDQLPQELQTPLRTEEKRLIMSAVHAVRMLRPDDLLDPDRAALRVAIDALETSFRLLIDSLERNYLVRIGGPRQMLGEQDETT